METTPPEAWIAAEILPRIRKVRANVEVDDEVFSEAVQKYLRCRSVGAEDSDLDNEQKLYTTIQNFIPAIEKLLCDIFDRRKGLADILALARDRYGVGQPIRARVPSALREQIILRAIKEKWSHPKLANELDRAKLKPKSTDWKSFKQMFHDYPEQFYSMKSYVKKKYLVATLTTTSKTETQPSFEEPQY